MGPKRLISFCDCKGKTQFDKNKIFIHFFMKKIKNIIFDLGNVLFPISGQATLCKFQESGVQDVEKLYPKLFETDLPLMLEVGKISPLEFLNSFNRLFGANLSQETFNECWNAMIVSYPEGNTPFLEKLKSEGYNLYVLSNTNAIHVDYLERMAQWREGLFSKIYYSNEIHSRKPDLECFSWVINDAEISPEESVFIDDRAENIEGAQLTGLNTIHLTNQNDLYDTLENYLK